MVIVVRQERIHQRKCGEICSPTRCRRGHPVTRGCDEKRYVEPGPIALERVITSLSYRSRSTSIESESNINEVVGEGLGIGIRKRRVATAATA